MRCRNCGSEVDEGASFCGNCGSNNLIDMSKINNKAVAPANAVEVNNAAPVNAANPAINNAAPMAKATPMVNAAPMANAAPAANYNQAATYEEKPKATRSKGEVINRVMGIIIGVANFGVIALLFTDWINLSIPELSISGSFGPLSIYKLFVFAIKSGEAEDISFFAYLCLSLYAYFYISAAVILFCSSYRLFTDHCYASMQRRGLRNAFISVFVFVCLVLLILGSADTTKYDWIYTLRNLCSISFVVLFALIILLMIFSKIWINNSRYDFNGLQRKIYNTVTRLFFLGIVLLFLYLIGVFNNSEELAWSIFRDVLLG